MHRRNLWGKWDWIIWSEGELADVELILDTALLGLVTHNPGGDY